jgi:hypothetical protein
MKILLFLMILFLSLYTYGQSVANFTDINNHSIATDSFQNKKLMVILLPALTDTALQGQLLRFQARHTGEIRIIGLIDGSWMGGLTDTANAFCQRFCRSGIIVSAGLLTISKNSGQRDALLQWVTSKSQGRQWEAGAPGREYFISESGRLYAVLGPETSLDSPTADYLVKVQVPGETR